MTGKKRDGSQVEDVKPSMVAPKLATQIKLKKEVASAIPKKTSHASSHLPADVTAQIEQRPSRQFQN